MNRIIYSFFLLVLGFGALPGQGPTIVSVAVTPVKCSGGSNGAIQVTGSGTAPLQYSINGGQTWQTGATFSGLIAGNYSVQIKDGASQVSAAQFVQVTSPARLTVTRTSTPVSCYGSRDGTLTINCTGGVPPYQYSINNGATYVGTNLFTGLAAGNNYYLRVRDANGCVSGLMTGSVSSPGVINMTQAFTNPTCADGADGTITLTGSGGKHAFEYSIDGGQTWHPSGQFSGLTAGTYPVSVRDLYNACPGPSRTVTLAQPDPVGVVVDAIPYSNGYHVSCPGRRDGRLAAVIQSGTAPFSYLWSNGQTAQSISGLEAGAYTVTVTDARGCQAFASNEVVAPPAFELEYQPCHTVYAGSPAHSCVTLTVGTGNAPGPFLYFWSTGQRGNSITVCPTATSTYQVTVYNGNDCPSTATFKVNYIDATCGKGKVKVCHNPGLDDQQELCLDLEQADEHLAHGAGHQGCRLGSCADGDPCIPGTATKTAAKKPIELSGGVFDNPTPFMNGSEPILSGPQQGTADKPVLFVNRFPNKARMDIVVQAPGLKEGSLVDVKVVRSDDQSTVYQGQLPIKTGKAEISLFLDKAVLTSALKVTASQGKTQLSKQLGGQIGRSAGAPNK